MGGTCFRSADGHFALALTGCFSDTGSTMAGSADSGGSTTRGTSASTSTTSGPGTATSAGTSAAAGTTTTTTAGTDDTETGGIVDTCDIPALQCAPDPLLCEGFETWTVPPDSPWTTAEAGSPPVNQWVGMAACGDSSLQARVGPLDDESLAIATFGVGALGGQLSVQTYVFINGACMTDDFIRLLQLEFRDGPSQIYAIDVAFTRNSTALLLSANGGVATTNLAGGPPPAMQWFELRVDLDLDVPMPSASVSVDGQLRTTGAQVTPGAPGIIAAQPRLRLGPFRYVGPFEASCIVGYDQVWVAPTPP